MAAAATQPSSHAARNVVIVIVVLLIATVAFLFLTQGSTLSPIRPSTVLVSGAASTTGFSTHAVSIGFTSDAGQLYTSGVVSGQYSLSLPNDHTYSVQISWSGALGSSGTCNAGSLAVSQGPGSSGLMNNYSC